MNEFNLTEEVEFPIFTNKSTLEMTLPVFLNRTQFDKSLLSAPLTLKEYIAQYKHDKETFDLKERHDIDELEKEFANKNFLKKIINFLLKQLFRAGKLSAKQDSNLHPTVSGRVPLPLDHLHSMLLAAL